MRNRSAIWIFTILLFLACLYQLSFSWVTKSFESDIHDLAETKYDSLSNEAVEFVINGDTLVIGPDKEKQQIISFYEQKLLAEKADQPTYPVIDLDYQRCKDQELGLGLDLQDHICHYFCHTSYNIKFHIGNKGIFILIVSKY